MRFWAAEQLAAAALILAGLSLLVLLGTWGEKRQNDRIRSEWEGQPLEKLPPGRLELLREKLPLEGLLKCFAGIWLGTVIVQVGHTITYDSLDATYVEGVAVMIAIQLGLAGYSWGRSIDRPALWLVALNTVLFMGWTWMVFN